MQAVCLGKSGKSDESHFRLARVMANLLADGNHEQPPAVLGGLIRNAMVPAAVWWKDAASSTGISKSNLTGDHVGLPFAMWSLCGRHGTREHTAKPLSGRA